MSKTSQHKIGVGLLTAALLVAAFIAIRQMIRSKSAVLAAAANLDSASTPQAANLQTTLVMPDFPTPGSSFKNGIPRLALLDTTIPDRPLVDVATYVVQPGDNLFMIAEKYCLRPETVLWGNYEVLRDNPQFLRPEQELTILPTDGVYYQWTAGDNLNSIASFFRVEPDVIINYPGNRVFSDLNAITSTEIAVGTWLIIPGGERDLKDWGHRRSAAVIRPPRLTMAPATAVRCTRVLLVLARLSGLRWRQPFPVLITAHRFILV